MVRPDRLVDTFLQLVHVNSPSLHERAAMEVVQPRLERLGFSVSYDNVGQVIGGDTGNLIARRAGSAPAPPIFLNAHIDTVQPTPDIHVLQENGIIRTDGTTILGADDKAGVACILEALESLAEADVALPDVEVLITVAEEIGLLGSRHLEADCVKARTGWVMDSGQPLNSVIVSAPSQDRIHAVVQGKAAHAGSRPEEGVSAITVAAHAIAEMPLGRIDEETTANVGIISGGQATNIVAPRCELWAEARSRNAGKLGAQAQAMVEALHRAASSAHASVDVTVERVFEAFTADADERPVRIACEAMTDLGMQPILSSTGGGMDANNFREKGMQCAVVGCGYRDIHSSEENIAVDDLATGARIMEAILRRAASR